VPCRADTKTLTVESLRHRSLQELFDLAREGAALGINGLSLRCLQVLL